MRLPTSESTPVRLRYAVGSSAERASRTYSRASSALNFPMVIWGLFLSAIASACAESEWCEQRVAFALRRLPLRVQSGLAVQTTRIEKQDNADHECASSNFSSLR